MFDIGGVELMVIAAVAILVVGPRELPAMLRGIGKVMRQVREMTGSVQRQFNDALKEAELDDVKKTFDDVRALNPANQIKRTIAKEMKPLTDVGDSLKTAGQAGSIGKVQTKSTAPDTEPTAKQSGKLGGSTAGDGSTLTPAKPRVKPDATDTAKAPAKEVAAKEAAGSEAKAAAPATSKKTGTDNGG